MKKELGLYIHIPFCKHKCNYCDFISFAKKEEYIEKYIEALKEEIIDNKNKIKEKDYEITTIYFGGGTPSFLDSSYIVDVLNEIKQNYNIDNNAEITIEVNPGTADEEKLKKYIEAGINRLSIGLQETNDDLLKLIGRIHNYNEFLETYNKARKVGFKNINVDLMIGLPNQTLKDVEKTLTEIINLDPEHISVYSLIVEEGTKIEKDISNGTLTLPDEEIERKEYWLVKNTLKEAGYIHYEISNFGKVGYESKHNLNCWNQKEYLGFGLAAHSYFGKTRYSNVEDLEKYINNNNKNNYIIHEVQDKEPQEKEYMLLGLRKIDGIKISEFKNKFVDNPIYVFKNELNKLVEEDLIEVDIDSIKLTNKGIDLANIVWEEFV